MRSCCRGAEFDQVIHEYFGGSSAQLLSNQNFKDLIRLYVSGFKHTNMVMERLLATIQKNVAQAMRPMPSVLLQMVSCLSFYTSTVDRMARAPAVLIVLKFLNKVFRCGAGKHLGVVVLNLLALL